MESRSAQGDGAGVGFALTGVGSSDGADVGNDNGLGVGMKLGAGVGWTVGVILGDGEGTNDDVGVGVG